MQNIKGPKYEIEITMSWNSNLLALLMVGSKDNTFSDKHNQQFPAETKSK